MDSHMMQDTQPRALLTNSTYAKDQTLAYLLCESLTSRDQPTVPHNQTLMFNVSVILLAESGYFVRLGTVWFPDVHSVKALMLLKRKHLCLLGTKLD